jgi:hypothetical protein
VRQISRAGLRLYCVTTADTWITVEALPPSIASAPTPLEREREQKGSSSSSGNGGGSGSGSGSAGAAAGGFELIGDAHKELAPYAGACQLHPLHRLKVPLPCTAARVLPPSLLSRGDGKSAPKSSSSSSSGAAAQDAESKLPSS